MLTPLVQVLAVLQVQVDERGEVEELGHLLHCILSRCPRQLTQSVQHIHRIPTNWNIHNQLVSSCVMLTQPDILTR